MNDAERFGRVLVELRALLMDLQMTGIDVVLVGGQVVALEALAAGGSGC